MWTQLSSITQYALLGWVFGLLALIVAQVAAGKILISGLLGEHSNSSIEVHRIQLLIVTVMLAGAYFGSALAQKPGGPLPDIPTAVLVGLVGSHGLYLRGKHAALRRHKGRER